MLNEGSWQDINSAYFSGISSFFVSKHFEVILEDIDQLIGLESSFHLISSPVNELIQLLQHVLLLLCVLLHLTDEVIGVVLNCLVHISIEQQVGLRLEPFYFIGSLKSYLQHLLFDRDGHVVSRLVPIGRISLGVSFNIATPFSAKISP